MTSVAVAVSVLDGLGKVEVEVVELDVLADVEVPGELVEVEVDATQFFPVLPLPLESALIIALVLPALECIMTHLEADAALVHLLIGAGKLTPLRGVECLAYLLAGSILVVVAIATRGSACWSGFDPPRSGIWGVISLATRVSPLGRPFPPSPRPQVRMLT